MHFEKCCTYSSIAKKHKNSVCSTSCAQVEGKEKQSANKLKAKN